MEKGDSQAVQSASVSELAKSVRDTYSRTGEIDTVALSKIVGSNTKSVEFSPARSGDPFQAALENFKSA